MPNQFFSLFGGIGGSDFGAKQAGYNLLGSVEFDRQIADLHEANHKSHLIVKNTKDVLVSDLPERNWNELLCISASPPCQPYSQSNLFPDLDSDRALALDNCYHIFDHLQPDRIIIENVRAYRTSAPIDRFRTWLKSNGYDYIEQIVNCANVGVPQSRIRYFLMADRHRKPKPLPNTHSQNQSGQGDIWGNKLKPWVGWYEAIADLIPEMQLSELSANQKLAIMASKFATESNFGIPLLIPTIGYHSDLPPIYPQNSLAPTVKAMMMSDGESERKGCWRLIEGCEVREMSVRGLARLQTFPDDLILSGNKALDCKCLGNAVPPLIMKKILEECFEN